MQPCVTGLTDTQPDVCVPRLVYLGRYVEFKIGLTIYFHQKDRSIAFGEPCNRHRYVIYDYSTSIIKLIGRFLVYAGKYIVHILCNRLIIIKYYISNNNYGHNYGIEFN